MINSCNIMSLIVHAHLRPPLSRKRNLLPKRIIIICYFALQYTQKPFLQLHICVDRPLRRLAGRFLGRPAAAVDASAAATEGHQNGDGKACKPVHAGLVAEWLVALPGLARLLPGLYVWSCGMHVIVGPELPRTQSNWAVRPT